MKILVYSRTFPPAIGGIETMMSILAQEFSVAGHSVTVVTEVPNKNDDKLPYAVERQVSVGRLFGLARKTDVSISANISLRGVPVLLMAGRPVFVHHGGGYNSGQLFGAIDRAKEALARLCKNVYCSSFVARQVGVPGAVIPNAYWANFFDASEASVRNGDLVCCARLVSEKGVKTIVEAVKILKDAGHHRTLTIVGDGPERSGLVRLTEDYGVSDLVNFLGSRTHEEIAAILSDHKVAVVPSLGHEGFGISVIEALAAGCRVITSDAGGLPEALGGLGIVFKSGDARELASSIVKMNDLDEHQKRTAEMRKTHLSQFSPAAVARCYLAEFQKCSDVF